MARETRVGGRLPWYASVTRAGWLARNSPAPLILHPTDIPATTAAYHTPSHPQHIRRTPRSQTTMVQHVGVPHRRTQLTMPQQFLHRPNVITGRQQVLSKGVPQLWHVARFPTTDADTARDIALSSAPGNSTFPAPDARSRLCSSSRDRDAPADAPKPGKEASSHGPCHPCPGEHGSRHDRVQVLHAQRERLLQAESRWVPLC